MLNLKKIFLVFKIGRQPLWLLYLIRSILIYIS